ncbi:sulfotransferase family protein [Geothermobacter hydrogeniphilus]|uniref:sulfotransferase family protein n=1 Tax=Geothermobacter hydrogeniphilus TaxID=1969733 RepID=UPI001304828C|nr:sulfotransferase [Geothermobacter hydrogeniphilus]
MRVQDHRYLIIGGAPKAGTTSLYKWLANHPDVCASSLKETRFFLDEGYPLPSAKRFDGQNLDSYDGFFTHCRNEGDKLRVEATPDYLYSKNALQIAELLPKAKIVFILRDPVDRVVSWYKYARQRGFVSPGMSFEQYVRYQVDNPVTPETPVYMRALEQSRYEKYLEGFKSAFVDRLLVVDFLTLKNNPQHVMSEILLFANISPYEYLKDELKAENVSKNKSETVIGKLYSSLRTRLTYLYYDYPLVYGVLKPVNGILKRVLPIYRDDKYSIDVTDDVRRSIVDYV